MCAEETGIANSRVRGAETVMRWGTRRRAMRAQSAAAWAFVAVNATRCLRKPAGNGRNMDNATTMRWEPGCTRVGMSNGGGEGGAGRGKINKRQRA